VTSRFCVAHPSAGLDNSFTPDVSLAGRAFRRLQRAVDDRFLRPVSRGYDYVLSSGASGFDIGEIVRRERPDIVQLHWIGGSAFRLGSLSGLRTPVVWRLSDQWPFCGVQHLEPDPEAYSAPPSSGMNVFRRWRSPSEHVRQQKAAIYKTVDQLVLVCPSRWLAAETRRSALLGGRPIELIPTSCDTDTFAQKDRGVCRAALGLSTDKRIVLVGATSMGTQWKGLDLFIDAMARLSQQPRPGQRAIQLVTFGKDVGALAGLNSAVDMCHLGPITDRRLMSIVYGAADVFAAPSRMENLANTVLESLACGTPAVAFEIGGMPDMIEHQINGYLAAPFRTEEFAAGLAWALADADRPELRAACRRKVLEGFSVAQEIDGYIALYGRVLGRRAAAAEDDIPGAAAARSLAS
jgi:glycosyltransferase involved in cell wall biosynthesis